jgi:glycosyltransferase involved in cell wall biosynthesis
MVLKNSNIDAVIFPITFESLISRARNASVAHFLSDKDATHLLFIDSDIEFAPEDVAKLINANRDVVCGAYPQKWLNIEKLQSGQPLEVCTKSSCHVLDVDSGECEYVTTGFLLIRRLVFETMMDKYKDRQYVNDIDGYMGANKDFFYDFFPVSVNEVTKRFESEDYGFSRLYRETGGKIYVVPDITLKHYGWFGYPGNLHRQMTHQ